MRPEDAGDRLRYDDAAGDGPDRVRAAGVPDADAGAPAAAAVGQTAGTSARASPRTGERTNFLPA